MLSDSPHTTLTVKLSGVVDRFRGEPKRLDELHFILSFVKR